MYNASTNDSFVEKLKTRLNLRGLVLIDGQFFHIRYCEHILNLIVQDGFKKMYLSMLKISYVMPQLIVILFHIVLVHVLPNFNFLRSWLQQLSEMICYLVLLKMRESELCLLIYHLWLTCKNTVKSHMLKLLRSENLKLQNLLYSVHGKLKNSIQDSSTPYSDSHP